MSSWSTADIPDQTGRTFVVTGANSGLGASAARALAAAGADVVLACRSVEKARPIAEEIGARARVEQLDLADLSSVRAFADRIGSLDVLINNAGIMAVPKSRTTDGFEAQFGTNHLGHFALTGLLLPKITARVVTLSSVMHATGVIHFDDLNYERRRYERWTAYGQSKLANLMFALELARRFAAVGDERESLAAHPGYASTNLQFHTENPLTNALMKIGEVVKVGQPADQGALPELYAATSPDAENGLFYGPDGFGGLRGAPTVSGYRPKAADRAVARALWDESEVLTGVTFPV
ncbi:oxidoreductase [Williamsia sterculiae]|uniref:NAD(P)-dependent dehydrogenase, short-chain alcohol dehydrogenase family n=1 Tax=Williamsia sterculiae TaxID=1344003 RepID=A0A1N7GWM3_9NOCA|nr:oxidoreductase [Williamsia sterculiae]SIS16969.1 NAD(P)-dependent dehydrogenase, short-chain alcohol dehydrogenase family [Williamsia sterculiae]